MQWLRTHPYASALLAAGILLVMGAVVVQRQSANPVFSQPSAWGGTNLSLLNPTSYGPNQNTQNEPSIMQQVQSGPPYTYIPPLNAPQSGASGEHTAEQDVLADDSFDLDAFIAMLSSAGGGQKTTASASATTSYSFIPSGLMSTTTAETKRTSTQQTLYDYGNEVGSYIQSNEEQNPGVAQILKNQVEDRADAGKAAAVGAIARGLRDVGESLEAIEDVPSQMASVHKALAKSYGAVGTNLSLIPKAQSDSEFIAVIEKYNASADVFVKNYIAFAELLGAYGVIFADSDAGSVFTFTPTSL